VTQGDLLALVIDYNTFTAADSIVLGCLANSALSDYPMGSLYTGSYSNEAILPCLMLVYSDGTYAIPDGCYPASAITSNTYNSGSSPNERGILFQVAGPVSVRGMWVRADLDNACDFILYDSSNSVLASKSYVSGERASTTGHVHFVSFASTVSLSKNTDYRMILKPTSGSSIVLYNLDCPSANAMNAYWGSTWRETSRSGGAWTDVTDHIPLMGLQLAGIDDATGGGGGAGGHVIGGGCG
jgi:hypothetical protein